MAKTAQECREHAQRLRLWADKQRDRSIREEMLQLADGWDLMARARECSRDARSAGARAKDSAAAD